jgi:hypothetical protein
MLEEAGDDDEVTFISKRAKDGRGPGEVIVLD